MDANDLLSEAAKVLGGGIGGSILGFFARKEAAKSEAVKELQLLKTEYKEFAEFTKNELLVSRQERLDCHKENADLKREISDLNLKVNELTMAMHNVIGTPPEKMKGLNNKKDK